MSEQKTIQITPALFNVGQGGSSKKNKPKTQKKRPQQSINPLKKELMNKTKEWLSEDKSTPAGAQAKKKETSYIG